MLQRNLKAKMLYQFFAKEYIFGNMFPLYKT
jgi:hypothetical protein